MDIVKILIKANATIDTETKNHGWTPLYMAVEGGHEKIVEILLENGADPNLKMQRELTFSEIAEITGILKFETSLDNATIIRIIKHFP